MCYEVIHTGSKGNSIIYHGFIMVDCGVSFASVKPYLKNISIVLLSHEHKDHINISTLIKMQSLRPSLRIGCCEWMLPHLTGLKNIDVYKIGLLYNYGFFQLSPIKLYHDVDNCGYRLFKGDHKIIHATDTAHLNGITAKGYDLFAIEANYDEETHLQRIEEKRKRGEYAHEVGAMNSHLSFDQAWNFINQNRKETSEVLRLHETEAA